MVTIPRWSGLRQTEWAVAWCTTGRLRMDLTTLSSTVTMPRLVTTMASQYTLRGKSVTALLGPLVVQMQTITSCVLKCAIF